MVTMVDFEQAALRVVQNVSIPVREPSYNAVPFWGAPLTITRARPIPALTNWIDYLVIPPQDLYPRVIKQYIATSQVPDQLEYRWLRTTGYVSPDTVDLPPNVERHLDRFLTHPYPCRWRPFMLRVGDSDRLVLQVRNPTAGQQLAFAAVFGWYYPSLESPSEISQTEGVDGTVRDF